MSNVKWVKLKDAKTMNSSCNCFSCDAPRDLEKDPSVCPGCGFEDFRTDQSAVRDLLESRTKNLCCFECLTTLEDELIDMYPRRDGWKMPGVAGKWWMSITCPQCGYGNSFDKFGISR
jgi:predicted nucleic-acid-binding Zn-ribbon protein